MENAPFVMHELSLEPTVGRACPPITSFPAHMARLPLVSFDFDTDLRTALLPLLGRGIAITHRAVSLLATVPCRQVGKTWYFVETVPLPLAGTTAAAEARKPGPRVSLGDAYELLGSLTLPEVFGDKRVLALAGAVVERESPEPSISGIFRKRTAPRAPKVIRVTTLMSAPAEEGVRLIDTIDATLCGDMARDGLDACTHWPAGHHVLLAYR